MENKVKKSNNLKYIILYLLILVVIIVAGYFILNSILKEDVTADIENKEIVFNTQTSEDLQLVKAEKFEIPEHISATVPIFMYHFILEDYGDYPDTENFLKPETLEEQLKYISENGYDTIYIDELDDLYKYDKPVALTFDDCFVYFYDNAFPLLKKYNQKATIFIITDYINGENYLTEEQLKEIADSGLVKIESHTKTHDYLDEMNYDEQVEQAVESKERLEAITGQEVTTYCYPSGRYNQTTLDIIKDYYDFGLEMLGGVYDSDVDTNPYQIPRIYANRSMSLSTFASYLEQSRVYY